MWQVGRKGVSVGINYTETSVVRAFKFERGKTRSLPLAKETGMEKTHIYNGN